MEKNRSTINFVFDYEFMTYIVQEDKESEHGYIIKLGIQFIILYKWFIELHNTLDEWTYMSVNDPVYEFYN